ncbi:restriction endonuclease subunit S [Limosilactobacillus mucosae]
MTKQNEKDAKRVPELRFKGFADAWEQRKLGDLGSVQMNKRIFKDQTSESGEVPFFKIGTFGKKPDSFISKKLFDEYKSKYPYPKVGDILISASGSIGRTVVYKGEDAYFQDSNIVWLEHDGRLKNSFLEQFLKRTKWNKIEGSTIKRLYNKDILNKKINLPKLKEQEKIGQLFQYLDKTITLHEEKQRQLELLKKALLQKMFADNTGYPALRFKGFSDAWKHRKLGDVSLVRTGYAFKSSDFSKTGQYKIVTNKEFSNSSLSKNMKADRINISDKTLLSKYELSGQNILVTMDGVNIGKASLFSDSSAVLAQRVGRINSTQLDFIFSVINNSDFVNTMRSLAVGNAIKHISLRQISSYVFRSPISIKEQKLIGGLFKNFDNLITLHQHKIDNLKRLKRALLQKMFV